MGSYRDDSTPKRLKVTYSTSKKTNGELYQIMFQWYLIGRLLICSLLNRICNAFLRGVCVCDLVHRVLMLFLLLPLIFISILWFCYSQFVNRNVFVLCLLAHLKSTQGAL